MARYIALVVVFAIMIGVFVIGLARTREKYRLP